MKQFIWIGSLLAAQFQFSMAFASFETMNCKGTGAIDGIEEISFQESDLEGQVCGYLQNKQKNYTCFNGSLSNDRMDILSVPTTYGTHELQITFDPKNQSYILGKYFVCDFNHEEKCIPGNRELIAEERIQCEFAVLKH